MEHMTQFYDSTVSDSFFSFSNIGGGTKGVDLTRFMTDMLSTLDLHKLASLYYQQLTSRLPISAMTLSFTDGSLTVGSSNAQDWQQRLDCQQNSVIFAHAYYSFHERLGLNKINLLRELHGYFKMSLKNALDHQQIKHLASRDHLTNLGNRVHYEETVKRLISHAKRHKHSFGLLLIDLDKFKQVNDKQGHQQGDQLLIAVAEVIQSCLRESDYAFRWGGDEFCCLLPESCLNGNAQIGQRIREAFTQHPELSRYGISCSIGSANFSSTDSAESLLARADNAMFGAKENGRDCFKAA